MFLSGKKTVKSSKKMSRQRYFDVHYHENRYGTSREREHPRGIKYQDDPLSPINSDDESYLYKSKSNDDHYLNKTVNKSVTKQTEKLSNNDDQSQVQQQRDNHYRKDECYSPDSQYHKDTKYASSTTTTTALISSKDTQDAKLSSSYQRKETTNKETKETHATNERLARLETMLEELMKRTITNNNNNNSNNSSDNTANFGNDKVQDNDNSTFVLEPRRHDFTTSQWINKIQEASFINNWNEKTTIQYMETQMSGIIKAWYNNLPNRDFSWPEWKLLITKTFPDNIDFITTLKRLVTRIKSSDETVTNYYFSKMYLIEACKITGIDAVSCLIDGLNNQQIQDAAKQQHFITPETLYAEYLSTLPDYAVDYSPPDIVLPPPETNHWYYDEKDNNDKKESTFDYKSQQQQQPQPQQDYDFDNEDTVMYNTDNGIETEENGSPPTKKPSRSVHSRLDKNFLHFRRRSKRQPLAMKICTICKERGHIARQCKIRKRVLFCQMSNNNNNSLMNCKINGQSIDNCLIDTGSTILTIRKDLVDLLNLKTIPKIKTIEGFGGFQMESLGVVRISLEIDMVKITIEAVVVPNKFQDVPVIIGQSLFNKKTDITMLYCNDRINIFDKTTTSGITTTYN